MDNKGIILRNVQVEVLLDHKPIIKGCVVVRIPSLNYATFEVKAESVTLSTPIDHTKVMAAMDKKFEAWFIIKDSRTVIYNELKAFIQSALKGEIK